MAIQMLPAVLSTTIPWGVPPWRLAGRLTVSSELPRWSNAMIDFWPYTQTVSSAPSTASVPGCLSAGSCRATEPLVGDTLSRLPGSVSHTTRASLAVLPEAKANSGKRKHKETSTRIARAGEYIVIDDYPRKLG